MTNKTVSFHDNPPDSDKKKEYKEALKRAKNQQKERPGDLKDTPRFDQSGTWSEGPSDGNFLSPETKKGLEAMARSAKYESDQSSAQKEEVFTKEEAVVEEELTKEEKLRKVVESRLEEIDIGEYLMSGELRQEIPIIPEKLVVVYKTVSDLEESYVDTKISEDTGLTNRQFLRKMNELALVIHIHSVNGQKWPTLIDGDGTINEKSANARLRHIKKLSSPVFNMLTQNLAWFMERVSDSLTASALGNG